MAEQNSTFKGGPAFGPNREGSFDLVVVNTTATADNALDIKYTTSGTYSGYDHGVYVALNIDGTTTGGNAAQRHAFATDVTIAGNHTSWIGGAYFYIGGTNIGGNAVVYGLNLHIAEIGICDYIVNLWLQRDSTSASSLDAYILMSGHPATQSTDTVLYMQGTAPTNFLQLPADSNNGFWSDSNPTAFTASRCIRVRAGTNNYNIPLAPAT